MPLYRKSLIAESVGQAIDTFRGRIRACVIRMTRDGEPSGELGDEEQFVCVDGLWYAESSIKAGARGYRREQLSELVL